MGGGGSVIYLYSVTKMILKYRPEADFNKKKRYYHYCVDYLFDYSHCNLIMQTSIFYYSLQHNTFYIYLSASTPYCCNTNMMSSISHENYRTSTTYYWLFQQLLIYTHTEGDLVSCIMAT